MRLGVIVLAHRNPEQLALLLRALEHPAVRVYLHVDAASPWPPFETALDGLPPDRCHLLPRRRSRWGGIEVVDASLDGLSAARSDGCDYVVQISGQDAPLWPVEGIVEFFEANAGTTFVEHFPLPDDRWRLGGRLRTECYTFTVRGRRETHVPRRLEVPMSWKGRVLNALLGLRALPLGPRRVPGGVRLHGGSQWLNLSREAVEWILRFHEENPGYRAYHEHTLLPDEIFFQSLLAGTDFAQRHDVVDDALRYMRWPEGSSHPGMISEAEFPALVAAGVPFGRKFDPETARAFLAWRAEHEEAHG